MEQATGLLNGLFDAARNLTYASIGIVGAVGEEAEEIYRRSIKRGKGRVRKLTQRLPLPERLKRAPEPFEPAEVALEAGQMSQAASAEWRAVLERLNLADPQDIKDLSEKIAELEAKLDSMAKES
jgi:uncharacterized protein YceH (UPF0502 family)